MLPSFNISSLPTTLNEQLRNKIDQKTKPLGSLGQLEDLAFRISTIQQTLTPELNNPHIVVFAADHGAATAGISAFPQKVTHQMVLNFLHDGAAINAFTRQNNIELLVVDAGVNHDFEDVEHPKFLSRKVRKGTRNYLQEAAMTEEELHQSIQHGVDIVASIHQKGCNIIGFGEMGIGNTSSASLIMSKLLHIPLEICVGPGTGHDETGVQRKRQLLRTAYYKYQFDDSEPLKVMQTFGGYELAMMMGAYLKAAELGMTILVDGFITSAAFLCATRIDPTVSEYAIFSHQSKEPGHLKMLEAMNAKPLLDLGLRLGEGTGCAVAYPLLESAVRFLNEMASFESAKVSSKD